MKILLIHILTALIFFGSCSPPKTKHVIQSGQSKEDSLQKKFKLLYSDITVDSSIQNEHFRGLHINENTAYVSGSLGSIATYDFKSHSFFIDSVGPYHFRDIHFINDAIHIMSIQNPAALFSQDQNTLVFITKAVDTLAFFDGIDFWDNGEGLLFGDPIDSFPYITKLTSDNQFLRIPSTKLPQLILNEAGFAASGTSIDCIGKGVAYIGWGGDEVRVFKTLDYGQTWVTQSTPMPKHQTGTGIYSLAFKDEMNGVAVGGNWEFPECDSSKIYTNDGGETWQLAKGVQGYRSCVTHVKDNIYISTGTKGTDISYDDGKTWELLDTLGFNAIQFSNCLEEQIIGIGVGNYGLIKKIELKIK